MVTKINGQSIANGEDLVGAVQSSSVGSKLRLTIMRTVPTQTVTVTIGEAP